MELKKSIHNAVEFRRNKIDKKKKKKKKKGEINEREITSKRIKKYIYSKLCCQIIVSNSMHIWFCLYFFICKSHVLTHMTG